MKYWSKKYWGSSLSIQFTWLFWEVKYFVDAIQSIATISFAWWIFVIGWCRTASWTSPICLGHVCWIKRDQCDLCPSNIWKIKEEDTYHCSISKHPYRIWSSYTTDTFCHDKRMCHISRHWAQKGTRSPSSPSHCLSVKSAETQN